MNLELIMLAFAVIAALIILYTVGTALSLWVQALVSGAKVGLLNIR